MAIDKPSLNDFLPNGFETQDKDGYKVNFDADKISAGYDKDTLEILSGPNLNNLLDNVGKNTHTLQQFLTFFKDMPIGSFPIVNTSNQLDYKSVNSFFRNVGEIVFSAIPLEDGNLRLLDGSLLEYTMTYSRFITYIANYRTTLPNLFCTQVEFDQSVATYGVCGKFVYDSVTKSLRLPKISGFIKGTLDSGSLGDVDEAKAPNITGTITTDDGSHAEATGAFYFNGIRRNDGALNSNGEARGVTLDASRSSDVYKNGATTIEPQAIKEFIYMVVSIDEAEKQVLSAVYNYKGSVETYADLPTAVAIGEVYNVIGEDPEGYSGANFAWTGEEWDRLGGTVNLSGYLTKVEGANTYATKASLESNVEVLQQQINTNASNIANIASEEVIQEGIKKIEMLKFASTLGAGKVADTDLFEVIKGYKYSSFDLSKFTVVGSPVITNDGIVSGFSSSNYINVPLNTLTTNNFDIDIKFKTGSTYSSSVIGTIFCMRNASYGLTVQLIVNTNGRIGIDVKNNENLSVVTDYYLTDTFEADTEYSLKIKINSTSMTVYKNDTFYGTTSYSNSSFTISDGWSTLGIRRSGTNTYDRPFLGVIDLKQFNITVDGVPVFSGNKTGIDTIKPTKFTVRTNAMKAFVYDTHTIYADSSSTPTELYNVDGTKYTGTDWAINGTDVKYNGNTATYTSGSDITSVSNPPLPFEAGLKITADGIASGFGENKYITLSYPIGANKKWRIEFEAPVPTAVANNHLFYDLFLHGTIAANNNVWFQLYLSDNTNHNCYVSIPSTYQGTYYKAIFGFDGINKYSAKVILNNGTELTKSFTTTAYLNNFSTQIGRRFKNNKSFDINSFRLYIEDNLVYQPCLKIPYTESKTGLKVTDKLDRAIDMAEQCGFSQYFGLDEQNGLCLVPQGDNITGRRELISRVEDSVTHYATEIYSDLYCRQMGSGTATTAVTLDIPFKDGNYKLSVPQSAKSKTGFTPTASCDWTAEGYIYLDEVI